MKIYGNLVVNKDIQELIGNMFGKSKEKFLSLLTDKTIILTKDKSICSIDDLKKWENPRLKIMKNVPVGYRDGKLIYRQEMKYPKSKSGTDIYNECKRLAEKYNVMFLFCTPEETEKLIQINKKD